jgi:anti-sigma factor RsiW
MSDAHEKLDLDWLAFCYAAGELDAEQAAAFEALLAECQEARERLAAIVAMTRQVARVPFAAPAPCVRSQSRQVFMRLAWLAAGAAALLAAIWLGKNLADSHNDVVSPGAGKVALADAWADSLVEPAAPIADVPNADEQSAEPDLALMPAASEGDEDDVVDIPEWMIAALGGETSQSDKFSDEETDEFEEMFPETLDWNAFQDG